VKLADVADAVAAGADELDVVIDRAALLKGRYDQVAAELVAVREVAGDRPVKVIIESGELADLQVVRSATWVALAAGADMVETSTGKSPVGATLEATYVICTTVREFSERFSQQRGVKVSGGVRTVADAVAHRSIAVAVLGTEALTPARFRLGASALIGELVRYRRSVRS
jgi:deoxyribose-phosphate aldolase